MANIHINFTKFDSLIQIADFFSSEEICKAAIAQERWGDGAAVCPYCGLSSVVDTEYRAFKHNVYFHWYGHKHRVA